MVKLSTTPIEKHYIDKQLIGVKREDLCAPHGAPSFSKIRGIVKYLKRLKSEGVKTVAYVETSISMAGWGLAWATEQLGMRLLIYDPQYKKYDRTHTKLLLKHREEWKKFSSTAILPIPAGRAKVNWYKARKEMKHTKIVLLPLGIPLADTVNATAEEVPDGYNSIVVNVGSGTICAGILKGLVDKRIRTHVFGILGRSGNISTKTKEIDNKAGFVWRSNGLTLIDPGWEYTQASNVEVPFPCHPFYDAKAWEWLIEHHELLRKPILFWNIGSCPWIIGN